MYKATGIQYSDPWFLKVTLYLQLLLYYISYIPRVEQYILKPVLHPIVCAFCFPTPIVSLPSLPIGNHLFVLYICESVSF